MRSALAPAAALAALLVAPPARSTEGICLYDEGVRLDAATLAEAPCVDTLKVVALRGEHVAFQIAAPRRTLEGAVAEPGELGTPTLFEERYVDVRARSRNARFEDAALPFSAAARPAFPLGLNPDPLLPIELARAHPQRDTPRVLFAELLVPRSAAAGTHEVTVALRVDGAVVTVHVPVEVLPLELPRRAISVFSFYELPTLQRRFEHPEQVERRVVGALHDHGVESITVLREAADVRRVHGGLTGAWFDDDRTPASLVALGAYGTLGEPTASAAARVAEMVAELPPGPRPFVYAIDEQCDSPRGPAWRRLLREAELSDRVASLHTCAEPPTGQDVDIVMTPADAFDPDRALVARASGKEVWVYNGRLPKAGAMALDVPLTSLTANGWIAASFDVGRWFYWESTFWDDKNRGGLGPRDVFADAETFHNADGDAVLYDGLLLYPGRAARDIGGLDLGVDDVFPSLRLKALRRGIEDAALLGLAASIDLDRTQASARRVLGRALDEVSTDEATAFASDPATFTRARSELKSLLAEALARGGTAPDAARGLDALRTRKREERERTGAGRDGALASPTLVLVVLPLGLFACAFIVARWLDLRARSL